MRQSKTPMQAWPPGSLPAGINITGYRRTYETRQRDDAKTERTDCIYNRNINRTVELPAALLVDQLCVWDYFPVPSGRRDCIHSEYSHELPGEEDFREVVLRGLFTTDMGGCLLI